MFMKEQQEEMMAYWAHQRRPTEPMSISSVTPAPAVVTCKSDETPVHILSYRFSKLDDIQYLSFLSQALSTPENELIQKILPKGFTSHLGDFLDEKNIFSSSDSQFQTDVALIAENCAITIRDSRKGENSTSIAEFTVNGKGIRESNNETWYRFLQTKDTFQNSMYFKKCDLPRDITIPGIDL
jgi:hypothetical protein